MWRLKLWFLLYVGLAQAQVITTVAGTDPVFPAAGVQAVMAPLKVPVGVAVDAGGNIYVADSRNNIVARVSPDGTLTVVAGNERVGFSGDGGPATSASLNIPGGVALDTNGNLYIADYLNNRIRKVSNGTITTVAGNGNAAFSGDGGPATTAALTFPSGVAVDAAGNLYIADTGNYRVRKVTNGTITTVAGNGSSAFSGDGGVATSAGIVPTGVWVDVTGNLYIADSNGRVREVSKGTITTVAGNGSSVFSGDGGVATSASLDQPYGVTLDAAGNLYIADTLNSRVRKVSGGIITTVAGNGNLGYSGDGGSATAAALAYPDGVALDLAGNLYIADTGNSRIRKVSDGTITTVAGNGGGFFSADGGPATSTIFYDPYAVTLDSDGNLYFADLGNNRVREVSGGTVTTVAGSGAYGYSGDGVPATSAALSQPYDVAADATGNLYIADAYNNRIRKVSGGTITTAAGNGTQGHSGDGGPATSAELYYPNGVAVDSAGNLYIADTGNSRIRKVSDGTITTVAGNGTQGASGDGGPATSAELFAPSGVAVGATGNLYIADTANNRVRKVSGGTITTVAGSGAPGFSGDGGPATVALLSQPTGVALDSAENLYIADMGNSRIRKVSGGTITTIAGDGALQFSGDGGAATSAALSSPRGVAADSVGNLYIADTGNNRIREVLAGNPSYRVTPPTLSFSAASGGSITGGQTISFSSAVPGLAFTTSVSASWLTVTPSAGAIPTTLQVAADPSTLTAGTYQGTIAVTVPMAAPVTTMIAVSFTVQPSTPAALGVDTQNVSFTASQGGSSLSQQLSVLNTGGGSLTFTAAAATSSGGSWLSISPSSGAAVPSSPALLTVTAAPGSLTPGTYNGTITITGPGKSIAIPVTLSVSTPAATILLSQSALSFTAVAQGGVPLPQQFGILNTGQGSMSWTATAAALPGGNWLQISPASGTVARPYLDVSLVNVSIDPSTLGPGTYYGRIQVSAVAANSPQVMTVILTVLPAGSTLGAQVFPAGLIFTGMAGVTPGSQDVQIANPAGTPNSYQSGIIGTGLDYLPKNATLQPNQPTTVHVYADFSNLSPGSLERGTITLQFADGSPAQTISVLIVVAPSGTTANSLTGHDKQGNSAAQPETSGCAASGLFVVFRTPQPSQSTFGAVVGQGTTLEVQVTDGCGNLVGPGGQPASVKANFSNQDSVQMVHIGNGI